MGLSGASFSVRSLQLEGAGSHGKLLVVPIYAALQPEQQAKVFEATPAGMRKVVIPSHSHVFPARPYTPEIGQLC